MPSPLTAAGALAEPSKFAPLYTNRFFTGLWTQRSPLRDAAVPHLYEKYYSGSRFDSIIDGLNRELTSRLTLARRPGHTLYNSQSFPAINRFAEFRIFSTAAEIIKIMADCDAAVYDATGPSTKRLIWEKSAGAGSSYFQAVGNVMYFGNGVDERKWVQSAKSWAAAAQFNAGDFIVDTNNNIQVAIGARSATIINVAVSGNVVTLTTKGRVPFRAGVRVTLTGLTTATWLNNQAVIITTITNNQFSFAFTHADVASASDTGAAATLGGVTGNVQPAWPTTAGAIMVDNEQQWYCFGSSVMKWGIDKPTTAPTVTNAQRPSIYPAWQANTYYSPRLAVVDSHNNIQILTKSGKTGAAEPTWETGLGAVTTDGTAEWTNNGTAARQTTTAYDEGDVIRVQYTYWVTVTRYGPKSQEPRYYNDGYVQDDPYGYEEYEDTYPVSVDDFFQCTTAGTTGSGAPEWQNGTGVVVADGTVKWTNIGAKVQWSSIGGNTDVSTAQTVLDAAGNKQTAKGPGKSGASEPTWNATKGGATVDGTMLWNNAGSFSGANVKPWQYAYAFKNSLLAHPSTASPISEPIVLEQNKMIVVQGDGTDDPQADVIEIYRTAQDGSVLMYLAEIPNPGAGKQWTYNDPDSDDALNFLILAQRNGANDPPPAGAIAPCYHMGRIFVAVGNTAYYSNSGTTHGRSTEAFPPANNFVFPSQITRFWSTSIGLLVHTVDDIFIVLGQGTASSMFYAVTFLEGIGLLNYDAFAVNGSTAYLHTTASKTIALDPGAGVTEIGFPIGDLLLSEMAPASTYIAWHEGSSGDTALYVADGATGWYRMSPVAAPETGMVWSPRAVIEAGCKAVQSVKVQPGQKRLLVGPASNGPILQRDLSVHTDNGATYSGFEVIGSIVMAQPGQLAELEFITVDSVKNGKRPTLGILLGEISGKFEKVIRSRQDPPLLPPSKTLYNDRYILSQNMQPTFCRHFQLRFDWAAEDAASELLSYTIYGALHQERR